MTSFCAPQLGNLETVAQSTHPIFPDPRQVMLELVIANHELEAAISIMVVPGGLRRRA
jgi:hypothetical protein